VYRGQRSPFRRRRHGAPSTGLPRGCFVVAIQNHDQVGNRASGDRLSTLVDPPRLRLAAAMLLLSPYVPLIFMGEEYGETNPFQYFVDHGDSGLLEAVREGRRREFESFAWGRDVPDPACPRTFERSRLEWSRAAQDGHAGIRALYRDLLGARCAIAELRPAQDPPHVTAGKPGWIAVRRRTTLALFNCSDCPARIPFPDARAWTVRLATDAPGYAGTAESAVKVLADAVELPAWTAVLMQAQTF
jgi:maltooligosyltrehalose trehalohydrolase